MLTLTGHWHEIEDNGMTEAEWLACNHPRASLDYLRGKGFDRKLRLFVCAVCRRNWSNITSATCREAVEHVDLVCGPKSHEYERMTKLRGIPMR